MKYPSSWHKALWREGLVSGNGKIGANVYGGTKRESVLINHSALWTGTECNPLPDISGSLTKTRQAMDNRDFNTANWILTNALTESGYNNERGYPLPLAELNMSFTGFTGFSDYLENGSILAIEWSENIADYLPENTITVELKRLDETTREITIDGDERF